VDLGPVLGKCFDEVVNVVMFGEENPADIPKLHGIPLSIAIEHFAST